MLVKKYLKYALCGGIILLLWHCAAPESRKHTLLPAFYHWKTRCNPGIWENNTLREWHSRALYVRAMDIGWQNGAVPLAETRFDWQNYEGTPPVIPVFFILNQVFSAINDSASALLATRVLARAQAALPPGQTLQEIQIDCDWTGSTRRAYFRFLEQLQQLCRQLTAPVPALSATIRLHQVKYREKTGIPPVDRGLLMLYNFDQPKKADVRNSILDTRTAAQYLQNAKPYPIPLDVGLPLFAWGLHFRGSDFQGFLHALRPPEADTLPFLTRTEKNIYRVNKDTSCRDTYFRRRDWVRLEYTDADDLAEVWRLARPIIQQDTCRIVFFDLNTQHTPFYNYEDLARRLQMAP
jgi:hypothetical protein